MLDFLRGRSKSRTPIRHLLHEDYRGRIPGHTGAAVFGSCIVTLADTGYIRLFDKRGVDITDQVTNIGSKSDCSLRRGYEVADFLTGREADISVLLTDKLGEVQSIFGLSLSRLLGEQDDDSMLIHPMFGKPSGRLGQDVFVLMPFHESFSPVFDDHIAKVCKSLGLSAKRADDIFGSSKIIDDIWELIANSKIIIADCTTKNPNVFYELGIAHTLGKKVIIITQSPHDIPFDITHIRYAKYEYTPRGMKAFESRLRKFIVEASPVVS
jgi:hypothetical protein